MQKTILLVEDERIQAIVQTRTLTSAGFDVEHVSTGEAAVAVFHDADRQVDLVLMDIDLGPGIDGTEAAMRIQERSDVPILFLSSHTEPEYVERTERIGSYGYVVKNSGDVVLIASIRMAFRLYEAHRANQAQAVELAGAQTRLQELNYLMSQVIEQNPWSVAVFDRDMNFRYVSESFRHDFRAADRDLVGRNNYEMFPEVPERLRQMHERVLRGAIEYSDNDVIEYPDGTVDRTQWECRPWYTPDRSIGGLILYTGLLPESPDDYRGTGTGLHYMSDLRRYRAIEDEGLDIIYTVTAAGVFSYASPNIRVTLGYEAEEVVGKKFTFLIHPEDLHIVRSWWAEVEAAGKIHRPAEYRVLASDGSVRWHQLSGRLTDNPHEELIGICRDITDLKESEEDLRRALRQRDTVFRELKHRTRNSLSAIASILALGKGPDASLSSEQILERARGSVDAVLSLYERLDDRTPDLQVDLDSLLEDVARRTLLVYTEKGLAVNLVCDLASVRVDASLASTLGLVVNEAVTNAMKHSLLHSRTGTIRLRLDHRDVALTLRIEDHRGRSVPHSATPPTQESGEHGFGLRLIEDLAAQLGGSVAYEGIPDTRASDTHAVVFAVPLSPRPDAR